MIAELFTHKSAATVAGAVTFLALIDPAIKDISLAVIAAAVAIGVPLIALQTAKLNRKLAAQDIKVAEIVKVTDGLKTELIAATERAAGAEGELKAKADITAAVASGIAIGQAEK